MPFLRRVVVIPGRSMGPYVPQLLFPTFAAVRRGAEATAIEWPDADSVDGLSISETSAWVAKRTNPALAALDPESAVVVGKSLGTYAARAAARQSLPAIWVTPLLTNDFVCECLSQSSAPFLLVGGTADPFWDGRWLES